VLVVFATAPSFAQSDLQLNLTRKVFEASGARPALERVPALLGTVAESDPRIANLPPDKRKAFEEKFAAALDPDTMYRTMVEESLKRFREEPSREFLAVYRTALAERFVELDLRAMESKV
jgi:hypothetical protein